MKRKEFIFGWEIDDERVSVCKKSARLGGKSLSTRRPAVFVSILLIRTRGRGKSFAIGGEIVVLSF